MIAEYNRHFKKRIDNLCLSSLYSNIKNSQNYKYYITQEIAVKMPSPVPNIHNCPRADETLKSDNISSSPAKQFSLLKCQDDEKEGLYGRGLFHYSKWWKQNEVDIIVNRDIITGIPIFTDKNTLRVVSNSYSYFIPLEKVDYIRTSDGLKDQSNNLIHI